MSILVAIGKYAYTMITMLARGKYANTHRDRCVNIERACSVDTVDKIKPVFFTLGLTSAE